MYNGLVLVVQNQSSIVTFVNNVDDIVPRCGASVSVTVDQVKTVD